MRRLFLLIGCVGVFCAMISPARSEEELIDEIVAIVDDSIILKSDVFQQMAFAALQQGLTREQLAGSVGEDMFRSILDNMVQDELLIAKAKEDSLEVPSGMVEGRVRDQLKQMKEQHGAAEFSRQLAGEDLTEREVRDRLRKRFKKEAIRQMMHGQLVQEITVSPKEVVAFRKRYDSSLPPVYSVSHIMVSPKANQDLQNDARKKAEDILERVRNGEDFAELAKTHSEDPGSGPRGGDLGFFGRGDMVSEVETAVYELAPGEISEVIQSDFGFHVLKMEEIDGPRVRARHILFTLQPSEEDAAGAYQKAVKFYERVRAGEDFTELAKTESDHKESAKLGGKLGNYTEHQPPPGFATILSTMALGSVSQPVQTEFGWHVVKVTDDDGTVEELVRQVKIQEYFERVLAETREKLYVDIRIQ